MKIDVVMPQIGRNPEDEYESDMLKFHHSHAGEVSKLLLNLSLFL